MMFLIYFISEAATSMFHRHTLMLVEPLGENIFNLMCSVVSFFPILYYLSSSIYILFDLFLLLFISMSISPSFFIIFSKYLYMVTTSSTSFLHLTFWFTFPRCLFIIISLLLFLFISMCIFLDDCRRRDAFHITPCVTPYETY